LRALKQTFDDTPAEPGILQAHRDARGTPDRGARLASDHNRFPSRRRRVLGLRGDNLDFVAIDELGRQRCNLAVDLAADGRVANVSMNRIREVDRRGVAWKRDQLALRSKAKHLIMEQLELCMLQEFLRIRTFGQQLYRTTQPGVGRR